MSTVRRKVEVGIVATVLGVVAPAAIWALALTLQVGMCVNLGWQSSVGDSAQVMSTLANNNIKTVREDFNWSLIQPTSATSFDWSKTDVIMTEAARNGVDVLPILAYTPGWANGNAGINVVPATDTAYVNFVKAVFTRYGVDGTFWQTYTGTPAPLVEAEIWNEPWSKTYWTSPSATRYAAMVRAASTAIHSQSPSVKVLASVDYNFVNGVQWVYQMTAAMPDAAQYVDIADVHLYFPNFGGPVSSSSFNSLTYVRNALKKAGLTMPMWITESGVSSRSIDVNELGNNTITISKEALQRQANYYVSILNQVNTLAPTLNIQRYYAFVYQRGKTASATVAAAGYDGFYLADTNLQPTIAAQAIFDWVAAHPVN